ncbi:MAG: HD family phosphohydrolase [Chloroflexota bacterium]
MAKRAVAQQSRIDWPAVLRLALLSAGLAIGLALVLTTQLLPGRFHFNENDVVTFNVRSPRKVVYTSQIMTRTERDRAAEAVIEVTEFDAAAATQQVKAADALLNRVADARRTSATLDQKQAELAGIPSLKLSSSAQREALTMDDLQWYATAAEARRVLGVIMAERFTSKQLPEAVKGLPRIVDQALSAERRALISDLVSGLVRPTILVDTEATNRARDEARSSVQPVRVTVEKGEVILRDGDVVRGLDLEKLEQVGLTSPSVNWQDVLGYSRLSLVLVSSLAVYLFVFEPTVWAFPRRLVLVYGVVLLSVLAAKLIIPGREVFAYLFPVAAVPMLLATLLGAPLAIVTIAVLAPLMGMIANASLEMATASLVAGLVGLLGVWRMERQMRAYVAGLAVGVSSFLVVAGFKLAGQETDFNQLANIALACLGSGLLSTVVTLGTSSALGHIFGITTTPGLLELAHPSQPLFRRLLTEAPGTYHHSVVVANLSERAAQQVGADSLLARVGSYYHDIGKVVRPYCFAENQLDGQNVHDTLNPKMSAKLVTAHVRDGLQLALQQGLPSKVRDIIEQHHGTKFAKFFYMRACQTAGETLPDEADFRYPGPRPQGKEAAIVMLADSVEAAVRSVDDHSAETINKFVTKIVNDMLVEGQLDECDLSLRDLDRIKGCFATVLQGIFHPRVKYPEMAPPVEVDGQAEKVAALPAASGSQPSEG